jgi:hypothetical protein
VTILAVLVVTHVPNSHSQGFVDEERWKLLISAGNPDPRIRDGILDTLKGTPAESHCYKRRDRSNFSTTSCREDNPLTYA